MTPQTKKLLAALGAVVLLIAIGFVFWKTRLPENCYREQTGRVSETICD